MKITGLLLLLLCLVGTSEAQRRQSASDGILPTSSKKATDEKGQVITAAQIKRLPIKKIHSLPYQPIPRRNAMTCLGFSRVCMLRKELLNFGYCMGRKLAIQGLPAAYENHEDYLVTLYQQQKHYYQENYCYQ